MNGYTFVEGFARCLLCGHTDYVHDRDCPVADDSNDEDAGASPTLVS
jgi:hypothetical protein